MKNILLIVISLMFLFTHESWAEPWLANRYSQNCAGCHAPGRVNRKPKDRRCTLSCQGCHVNPNGGGLRNAYGKWNSERWLRSFYSKVTWSKKSPQPFHKQRYAKKKLSPKRKKLYVKKGAFLKEFAGVATDESQYKDKTNYKITAENEAEDLLRIPFVDPYRIERREYVQAGGDFRFFYIQQDAGDNTPQALKDGTFFPMVFDVGVRVRPIRENVSFVYEGRALNSSINNPSSLDRLFAGGSTTRSAYLLVDDLPYNTYFQYGIYRPLFGLNNPNHNAMIYDYMLGPNSGSQYFATKNIGFGLAPNVPFGMINMIRPTETAGETSIGSEEGFVVTAGLRFVSYGAHLVGSYWSTKNDNASTPRKRVMWDINGGASLFGNKLIWNWDIMNVDVTANSRNEAMIISSDLKYRVWREMYLQAGYSTANSAAAIQNTQYQSGISPGSGSELSFGAKAFMTSGLEFETLYTSRENTEEGQTNSYKEDTLQMQIHAYF